MPNVWKVKDENRFYAKRDYVLNFQDFKSVPSIFFSSSDQVFYEFSTCYQKPDNQPLFLDDGSPWEDNQPRGWLSCEHYYQAMQFTNENMREKIRQQPTIQAAIAFAEAQPITVDNPLDPQWELSGNCYKAMLQALYFKFSQNVDLKLILQKTDNALLVMDSPEDAKWGVGKDGKGENMVGRMLMRLRDRFRLGLTGKPFLLIEPYPESYSEDFFVDPAIAQPAEQINSNDDQNKVYYICSDENNAKEIMSILVDLGLKQGEKPGFEYDSQNPTIIIIYGNSEKGIKATQIAHNLRQASTLLTELSRNIKVNEFESNLIQKAKVVKDELLKEAYRQLEQGKTIEEIKTGPIYTTAIKTANILTKFCWYTLTEVEVKQYNKDIHALSLRNIILIAVAGLVGALLFGAVFGVATLGTATVAGAATGTVVGISVAHALLGGGTMAGGLLGGSVCAKMASLFFKPKYEKATRAFTAELSLEKYRS